jgi:hypothetical protein
LGEKMSDDEVDELLKAVDTSSGEINYAGTSTPRKPAGLAHEILTAPQTWFALSWTTKRYEGS